MLSCEKDPGEVLDYGWEWEEWLEGDTISAEAVGVFEPRGAQVALSSGLRVESHSSAGTNVTAWVSGGTAGKTYYLTCQVVTAGGRTGARSIQVYCRER